MIKILVFACLLVFTVPSVGHCQFKGWKCFNIDSLIKDLRKGNVNLWVKAGTLSDRQSSLLRHRNFFTALDINFIPANYLQSGLRFINRIPNRDSFSFVRSYELNPYLRYIFLRNGCLRTALFADVQYHFDHKVKRNKQTMPSLAGPTVGVGAYMSLGKSFRFEFSSSWFLTQRRNRGEISLIYNVSSFRVNGNKLKTPHLK